MAKGEVFFVAVGNTADTMEVLGFSSHKADAGKHRTAVYVRRTAARRGVGTALFRLAEADAVAAGADSLFVEASLAGAEFYKANGFEELGRGEYRLASGHKMACVFMRKTLRET
jgi:ribosomal protein S18 acetylase RimI-like enzyme